MSIEEMLKKIMADQAQLVADVRNNQLATQNLEKQFGIFASDQNSYPQGDLPGNTDPNPKQVNAVSTRSGRPLEELTPKTKIVVEKGRMTDEAGPSEPRIYEEPKDIDEDDEAQELASILDIPNVSMLRKHVEPLNRVLGHPPRPSIKEASKLELKALPSQLRYSFLGANETLPVILSEALSKVQVEASLEVLKRRKKAIGW
uniref:Integrase core domain containing protein n=1 Tax=Solanum tuberosum TaxID=4113 RepID=M1DJM2_SOLTU